MLVTGCTSKVFQIHKKIENYGDAVQLQGKLFILFKMFLVFNVFINYLWLNILDRIVLVNPQFERPPPPALFVFFKNVSSKV